MSGDAQSHLADFFVDALHKLKDEVDQLLLLEPQEVLVRDQEREVEVLVGASLSQDLELVGSQRHKSLQHVREQVLNFVQLLDANRYSHRVDWSFDHAVLVLTLRNDHGCEEQLGVVLELNFGVDLSLDEGRGEVSEVEHGVQDISNGLEVVLRL